MFYHLRNHVTLVVEIFFLYVSDPHEKCNSTGCPYSSVRLLGGRDNSR